MRQAAVNIVPYTCGAPVIATTRNADRIQKIEAIVRRRSSIIPDSQLRIRQLHPEGIDTVLDLVGCGTISAKRMEHLAWRLEFSMRVHHSPENGSYPEGNALTKIPRIVDQVN